MIRRPYRTKCRPFRDSSAEVTIHWYITRPENGVLPYPCRINSLDWRPDNLNPAPVGEVSWEDRPFDGWGRIIPPVGPGDHICGTRDDFVKGGLYDPLAPPLDRGPDGIPTCCRPLNGGLLIGGTDNRVDPVPPDGGGLLLGGSGVPFPYALLYSVKPIPSVGPPVVADIYDANAYVWHVGTPTVLYVLSVTDTVAESWRLVRISDGTTWETTGWDGRGTRSFTRVSGAGQPTANVSYVGP